MTDEVNDPPPAQKFVPVCAIGASAGGVAALQNLFRQLPPDLGMAYVVILHLNPDEPSALSDILSVCTRMPVHQVEDGPPLQPNCVYVIPPDRELVIQGNNVTARPFTQPRGQRAPIDMFFRSVAAGRGDGVAIVLSGAGSDGALGVSAMKEAGGIILVQEPAEAGFPSMPQSAIATGMADFVGPIARLAERLEEVARSKEAVRSLDMDGSANDLRRIVGLLRARTGHDFSAYKRATVMRRVLRRMQVCRTVTLADYADHLLTTPDEAKNLFSDLLISVTMFFRDEAAFEALARQAIRPMVENAMPEGGESLRIWVVGCATGEEAYSVAMLMHEELSRQKATIPFQIFATDLDDGALATARDGRYPRTIEADVSEERLARFFVDEGTHYRVGKELRENVLFAKHSILKEPPFMRLDLITCRNLLIYLERSLQAQICSIFHYSLRPGRYLFLGSAETVDAATALFAPLDRQARIYSSRPDGRHRLPVLPQFAAAEQIVTSARPAPLGTERTALPAALHLEALENNAPASALVDDSQNILHLSPTAGRFILHSAGPVSNALPAVVRPELRLDLRLALTRALEQGKPSVTLPTAVAFDGERRRVAMQIVPMTSEAQKARQALVFFLDGGELLDGEEGEALPETSADDVRRLYAELKASQEALLVSRSEHDASVQELRAANEELQSMNEEYRSTAEELETSKEELQSINEELHTVNAELKSKLDTISAAHSDLQNLTAATEIGTLFLDPELRIRFFTPPVMQLFNVTRHDIGRVITDFTHQLDYDGIEEDARKVLFDLTSIEREVGSRRGQRYSMRVRPYRTVENRIDGTVVTFIDISERALAEAALRESEARYRTLFESMDEAYAVVEVFKDETGEWKDFRFLEVNPAFLEHTAMPWPVGQTATELLGTPNPRWTQLYGQALDTGAPIRIEEEEPALARTFDLDIFVLDRDRNRVAVLFTDITARKKAEAALRESEERYRTLFESMDEGYLLGEVVIDEGNRAIDIRFLEANPAAVRMAGRDFTGRRMREIDPRYEEYWYEMYARVALTGEPLRAERYAEPHGRWFDFQLSKVGPPESRLVASVFQDITERKRTEAALRGREERQAFILQLSDALRAEPDVDAVANRAIQMLAGHMSLDRCYICFYRPDDDEAVFPYQVSNDTVPPLPTKVRLSEFPEAYEKVLRGTFVVEDDFERRGLSEAEQASSKALGMRAMLASTIRQGNTAPLASMMAVSSRVRRWTPEDVALVEEAAERTWAAMERARAEAAVRESEKRYRSLFAAVRQGLAINQLVRDENGHVVDARYIDLNPAYDEQTGFERGKAIGRLASEIFPRIESFWLEMAERVVETGQAERVERFVADMGSWFVFDMAPFEGTDQFVVLYDNITDRKKAEVVLRESEERQAFLLTLSDALRPLVDAGEIQATTTRLLGAHLGVDRAMYAEVTGEPGEEAGVIRGQFIRPAARGRPAPAPFPDHFTYATFGADVMARRYSGEGLAVADVNADPGFDATERAAWARVGVQAAIVAPLVKGGRLVAELGVHSEIPRTWTDAEISLVREVGERTWAAAERARVEAALRESEGRFRLIVESARDYAIFTIDQQGIVTSWPAGAANVFGWSEGEMLGQSVERMFVPEDIAQGAPEWERETAARQGVAPDVREHLCKDGRRIFIDGSVRPFMTGGRLQGFIKIGQDVTERREAEKALREGEERFRQYGEASRDILWMRDADTLQWTYLSQAFDEIYGLPRERALSGDNLDHWLQLIVPEDRENAQRHIERVSGGESVSFEFRIQRRSDGAIRWIRESDFPLLDAEGRVQRIGGIGRDVTEEKETAERMKVLVAELQHRTRNLIGVVRSVADRTVASAGSLEEFQESYRARLGALARVNGLLSRLNEGDRITLDELIRSELAGHGVVQGNGHDDQVTLDGPPGIRLRSATVQTFALALHELATNAVKYGALSNPDGRLAVTWRLIADGEARLRVEWREAGVSIDGGKGAPTRVGYGRELIERALPFQLQAETSYELGPDGVRCVITLPISTQHGIRGNA